MQEKKVFVRESSGLVREIDAKDAFSMNFSYLGPAAGVAYPLSFAAVLAGANWLLSGILAAIIMAPVAVMYYYLSRLIPRSAGDYIYISRTLGPRLGFVQAIANVFVFASGVPILAQLELPLVLEPSLQALGLTFHDPSLISLANDFSFSSETSPVFFAVTLVIIALATLVATIRTKVFARVVTVLTAVQIVGTIAMIIGLAVVNSSYPQAFTKVSQAFGGPSYSSLTSSTPSYFDPLQTLVLMSAIAAFLFLYNNAPTYFGGEIKKAERSLFHGIVLSYIVTAILSIALIAELQFFVGEGFYDYTSSVGWTSSNGAGIPIAPNSLLSYVVVPFINDAPLVVIMVAGAITWYLLYAILDMAIPSRTLFAMAFDWLAPTLFTKVSERIGTPIYSTLFIAALAVLFDALEIYFGFSESALTTLIVFMLYQYFTAAISAIVISRRKLYGVNDNKLAILGAISAFSVAFPAVLMIVYGIINGDFGSTVFVDLPLNLGIIIGVPLVSLALYEVARKVRERQGIDLSLTFKEIPPE